MTMTNKILALFIADEKPEGFLFMIDSDDERIGVDYFPVAVDCWFQPERKTLVTEHGQFHVDAETWEASNIVIRRAWNSL